jgi:hypothetical protein
MIRMRYAPGQPHGPQDEVARLITAHSISAVSLPQAISEELRFKLGLDATRA